MAKTYDLTQGDISGGIRRVALPLITASFVQMAYSMTDMIWLGRLGSESVAGRINVFVAAITCGMTVSEINELDLVYAPPVAPVYDPILIAASQAMKKVGR